MPKSFLYPGGREASGDTSYNRLPHGILWSVDELGTAEEMLKTLKVYGPADEVFTILHTDTTQERLTEREDDGD
jgi:hypothetical protein